MIWSLTAVPPVPASCKSPIKTKGAGGGPPGGGASSGQYKFATVIGMTTDLDVGQVGSAFAAILARLQCVSLQHAE
jgi:hypothetical protein